MNRISLKISDNSLDNTRGHIKYIIVRAERTKLNRKPLSFCKFYNIVNKILNSKDKF